MWNTKEYSIIELLELHEFGLCWLRITDEMARGIGMLKSVCVKNPDAITLRDCFGATALSTVNGLCTVFMSSMFMQYMTDYAGLGAMGATLATSLLLFARIFDAVDDPVQKDRSALTMVVGSFIVKAQAALSAAIIGAVLMAIGYNVDPVTSEYMGELSQIPTMLNWFIVIMGLVPAILGVLSALILRTYPIKNDERRKIRECLDRCSAG